MNFVAQGAGAHAQVEGLVKDYLIKSAGVDAELLGDSRRLISELGLDSLSLIELVYEVEDNLGVSIEDVSSLQQSTLADLYALVGELMEKKNDESADAPVAEAAV